MISISNEALRVQINEVGAELTSVQHRGLERIWEGDPSIWGKHAPLLFPLIGRMDGQQYTLGGQIYPAPRHGFCRERTFAVTRHSETGVTFHTAATPDTLAVYPFDFALDVTFALEGSTLVKTHRITNRSPEPMPFELGGHEAYRTTLLPGETMADYGVAFEGLSALSLYGMDDEGMLTLPKRTVALRDGVLEQLPADLGLDTIVLDAPAIRRASLVSRSSGRHVTVDFGDFDYLGIWTAQVGRDTNYLCIEPWSTLPDGRFMGRGLHDKTGIQIAQPCETRTLSYLITFP